MYPFFSFFTVSATTTFELSGVDTSRKPLFSLISSSLQHSVAIVHIPGRRPFGQNLVTVYIDGEQRITAQLRFPSFSEVTNVSNVSMNIMQLLPCCSSINLTSSVSPDSWSPLPPAASAPQGTVPLPPPPHPTCPCPRTPTRHRLSLPSLTMPPPSSAPSPSQPPSQEAAGGLWRTPQCTPSQQDCRTRSGERPRLWMGSWAPPSSATRLCSRHRRELCILLVGHVLLRCKCRCKCHNVHKTCIKENHPKEYC